MFWQFLITALEPQYYLFIAVGTLQSNYYYLSNTGCLIMKDKKYELIAQTKKHCHFLCMLSWAGMWYFKDNSGVSNDQCAWPSYQ